jgi:hypothetical protein
MYPGILEIETGGDQGIPFELRIESTTLIQRLNCACANRVNYGGLPQIHRNTSTQSAVEGGWK